MEKNEIYKHYAQIKYGDDSINKKLYSKDDRENIERLLNKRKRDKNDFDFSNILNKLDSKNIALIIYILENTAYLDRNWFSELNKRDSILEYDFRFLSGDEKYFTIYSELEENVTLIEDDSFDYDEIMEKYENGLIDNKYINTYVYKEFLFIKQIIKHPIRRKNHCGDTDNPHYTNPFKENHDILQYIELLNYYIIAINNKYTTNNDFFTPLDAFLALLTNSIEALMKLIDIYFDENFSFFKNINVLEKCIDSLNELNDSFALDCQKTLNKTDGMEVKDIFAYISCYLSSENRLTYTTSLREKLIINNNASSKFEKTNKFYRDPLKAKLSRVGMINSETELSAYCREKATKNTDTFSKNMETLKDLDKLYHLNTEYEECSAVPTIGLKIDMNILLDTKIIYHEFIEKKSECVNKKTKVKSEINISIPTILNKMIKELNPQNRLSKIEIDKFTQENLDIGKDEIETMKKNNLMYEKDNLLYKQTVILTEKLRRGYYRESCMLKQYELISEYKTNVHKLLIEQFLSFDIFNHCILFIKYFNNISQFCEGFPGKINEA